MHSMALQTMSIGELKPYPRNARTHSKKQIKQIAKSIERFGFTNPVLISDDNEIIAGHGRVLAAQLLGHCTVPTLRLSYLGPAERRAYVLADNKLAQNAGWDRELLGLELQGLIDLNFEVELTGFTPCEIDIVLEDAQRSATTGQDTEDDIPSVSDQPAIVRLGEVWQLGRHRLICGDARERPVMEALMDDERAHLIFTDPPYNVMIDGHGSGKGRIRHRECAMAAGEMSSQAFTTFLQESLGNAAAVARDGAIAFVCMDWRHMEELLAAGRQVFSELKNLCVWNKANGAMGTFYRSKHELVFVFKVGTAPHTFGPVEVGRYRTNVWDYAGVNTFRAERADELAMHPTVKPIALVADAIKDCSRRGEIVLDPFGGSGSTLIAAEKTGRCARLIELDPASCDQIIRRFENVTGKPAKLAATAETFECVSDQRSAAQMCENVR